MLLLKEALLHTDFQFEEVGRSEEVYCTDHALVKPLREILPAWQNLSTGTAVVAPDTGTSGKVILRARLTATRRSGAHRYVMHNSEHF